MASTDQDLRWLREAVALALLCPSSATAFSVGAVIVDENGYEISRGYSRESDVSAHAEEAALAKVPANAPLSTATIYSSLEPCGERRSRPRTCAQLIIEAGIRRVVFTAREPPTFVASPSGKAILLTAGIEVVEYPNLDPTRPN